ncbi:TRAP transporter small permease subunit [Pontibacillus yanchengensis]|uniref:TRAP transporter small permease subunit n=2 Tax=Pontibacillus yanchengensis TaxID=462910 RepID=A0ACC7VD17_9BACI|nr:TRAP transporter small permease [Pontibacillus yanchengensis]MYL32102.1 TRAP transporter small permease subunit [Pontibacillus yanchengensis]MYL52682.1 TRAP transporter small permease subunit [Pontibacillus yanchengensis]
MRTISHGISKIEKGISILLMFSMAIVVTLAVAFRYVLQSPLSWAGEISVFLLIWISFIGGSLGLKYKSQAAVTIVVEYIPENIKRMVMIVGHICMLLFLFILIYYSFTWILSPSVSYQKSTTLLVPMWIPYMAVPLGLTFAAVHLLSNLFDIFQKGESQ